MSNEELQPSELGTLEYWDKVYKNEVDNFRSHNDVGEIWFGEDISDRIVRWMDRNVSKASSVLDIGCGNGLLLVELANNGFVKLAGMDYSKDAIVLAREVSAHYKANIEFAMNDILVDDNGIERRFDVVLDKGTYDAISLMDDAANNRRKYIGNVEKRLRDDGFLIVTSCNWTKEELAKQFDGVFDMSDVIPTPQFKFGGKVGSVVSSVIFKRRM